MRTRTKILLALFVAIVIVDLLFLLGTLRGCAREAAPRKSACAAPRPALAV